MPLGRLLLVMSVPMMISMFVQALYNMVDSMFVAMISEDALTAVSLAFPMQNAMTAIGVGTGVGVNAFVSRSLGSGDREGAERAANIQMFLSACYTLVFVVIGAAFSRAFYTAQTDSTVIIEYGVQYMSIVCIFGVGCFYGQNLEKLLIATGSSALSMISQAAGAVVNIIFDPLLIFGVGPFPELGVSGAAIATVFGQMVSAVIAYVFCRRYNRATRFCLKKMLPRAKIVLAIYAVGVPSMITVGLASVMSYCMNQILLAFSTTATAVYGIWLKMQNFAFMPVYGMNNGTIAIYSYNLGARRYDRVRGTFRLSCVLGVAITVAAAVLYEALPREMLRLFSASDYMYSIGVRAIRIFSLSLPFGAACIVMSSPCQSLGHARYTMFINICRQLVIQVPAAFLLSLSGQVGSVWYCALISECASAVLAFFMSRKVLNGLEKQ